MLPSVKMLHEVDSSKADPGPRQYSETTFHEPVLTHFHHFNIQRVTDVSIFWQELTTVKQRHVNNPSFKNPSVIKHPNLPGSKFLQPFHQTFARRYDSSTNTNERSLYCIYSTSYCSSWHEPSRPMKDSGWRQTGSSLNDKICGLLYAEKKTNTVIWNDSER